ncbi:MAG: hypothetical protein H6Q00_2402 [Holophagaceae bacterium]|nr:hypothetical protein [Holophagaceae bacterium]
MIDHLGKYEILRSLGNGAMGEVYLAHHPVIGREVAIKTILPGVARGDDAEARFRREATAAGKLNHPNLVTIYDFDKDQGVLYLVMEYVKGEDLEDLIRNRSLSQSQFLEVLAQVCDGLGYAHRNGIIHRDIKPANVRVMQDGKRLQAKVMDFGIARMEDSNMTSTGIVMGTVSYMAPEYIQSGKASNLTDLFAVGVMLYECITGIKPFPGDNTTTVLFKIVSENPKPVDLEAIQGISPSVRDILDRALSKEPGRRYQSAEELAKALRACKDPSWTGTLEELTSALDRRQTAMLDQAAVQGTVMLGAAPAQPTAMLSPQATPPVPSPSPKSRTGLYVAAGLVLLAAIGGGTYMGMRKHDTPTQPSVEAPVKEATQTDAPTSQAKPPAAEPARQSSLPANPGVTPPPAKPTETKTPAPVPASAPQPPAATPKPAEDPAAKLARGVSLIQSDPRQAAAILRPLAYAQLDDAQLQGNYLAALYNARQVAEFERVLATAKGKGHGALKLIQASPAFRQACAQERAAQKARNGTSVWTVEEFARMMVP